MAAWRWGWVVVCIGLLSRAALLTAADEPLVGADGLLRVKGVVLMPDGSPAAGASVVSHDMWREPRAVARTDDSGRFELRDVFGNSARLYARSADGTQQCSRWIAASAVRDEFAAPIELRLAPGRTLEILVTADGKPAPGARVIALGMDFGTEGVSDAEGKVRLQLPAEREITELAAWHPELGVDGAWGDDLRTKDLSRLSLRVPAAYTIRAVDPDGKPVPGLELAVGVHAKESEWIATRSIAASHVRTNAEGVAIVTWAPAKDLKFVDADIINSDWKLDEMDREPTPERTSTLQVRRKVPVQGRLIMPAGQSAEGILVSGFAFGPGHSGDIPFARARADGSFTLHVPADHGYVLGILDRQWASDRWSGLIVKADGEPQAEIAIEVYPATPLTARVTRGPNQEPAIDVWVDLSQRGQVEFVDASGKKRRGRAGVGGWLRTDKQGVAKTGVGKGPIDVRVSDGKWDETQKVDVTSTEPVQVAFHRAWIGNRQARGRLIADGKLFQPSAAAVSFAWAEQEGRRQLEFKTMVNAEGNFQVDFDAERLSLLFVDSQNQRCGTVNLGPKDTTADVVMQPTAKYAGVLLDRDGNAVSQRHMRVLISGTDWDAAPAAPIDATGHFEFAYVPVGVPLELAVDNTGSDTVYQVHSEKRLFEPGEDRHDRVTAARQEFRLGVWLAGPAQPTTPTPLAQAVPSTCRNTRLGRMRTVVLLEGDDSAQLKKVSESMLDGHRFNDVYCYLPVVVSAAQLKAEAETLVKFGWPLPEAGEIVLVALDDPQQTIGTRRIAVNNLDTALEASDAFLKEHRKAGLNALELVAQARREAAASGRRVWFVQGGPRCGPCFRLARWMEEHHTTLDKDYVVVKVMEQLDENWQQIVKEIRGPDGGIPWYAITEADGTVLVTSDGPLGNMGFPSSVEDLRYLRTMLERTAKRLTPQDIDALVQSLEPAK